MYTRSYLTVKSDVRRNNLTYKYEIIPDLHHQVLTKETCSPFTSTRTNCMWLQTSSSSYLPI